MSRPLIRPVRSTYVADESMLVPELRGVGIDRAALVHSMRDGIDVVLVNLKNQDAAQVFRHIAERLEATEEDLAEWR